MKQVVLMDCWSDRPSSFSLYKDSNFQPRFLHIVFARVLPQHDWVLWQAGLVTAGSIKLAGAPHWAINPEQLQLPLEGSGCCRSATPEGFTVLPFPAVRLGLALESVGELVPVQQHHTL